MGIASVQQCLSKPTAQGLEEAFALFGLPGSSERAPCRRVLNNCAVRMCVALSRSMNVDILGNYTGGLVHSGRNCMGEEKFRHIAASRDLFNHLRSLSGFQFVRLPPNATPPGGKGILFFSNCFTRDNGTRGNHIDYWNGRAYTNAATGTGAPSRRLNLFDDADQVHFCRL